MSEAAAVLETNAETALVHRGWQVTMAGLGINLALGVLYTWSVISKGIPHAWNWSEVEKSLPYSIACLMYALMMAPAGLLQDTIGPRRVASIGGVLVGAGLILASQTESALRFMLAFGVLTGSGIGFAYASATPAAVKWFARSRTGMIAGIVVSGFGMASIYAAPLAAWLIGAYGVPTMCLVLGVAYLIVVVGLAQRLVAPPPGYVTPGVSPSPETNFKKEDFSPREMLSTWQFYVLWFMFACGAGAGLMIISKLAAIGEKQAGVELGFVLVAALAVGNGAGRVIAGVFSDRIGRPPTMFACFVIQAGLVWLLSRASPGSALTGTGALLLLSALIGANYGANLTLFPSITKDYFGLEHFGVNYGLVFTAWGVGGFMLALAAGHLYDLYQTFAYAYYGAATLLVLAALATTIIRAPRVAADVAGRS